MDNPAYAELLSHRFNRPVAIFNLSSLYSGFLDATNLITSVSKVETPYGTSMPIQDYVNTAEFDMYYLSYIFNVEDTFKSFMAIMSYAYEGILTCVLVSRDMYRDAITEALIKIIQQRYGYNCWLIESDMEDLLSIHEETFTPMGLTILHDDLEKFDQLNGHKGICVE
jgi:hypothetical protein